MKRNTQRCLAVIGLMALIGCGQEGPELAQVSGRVLDNGAPVAGVGVTFTPVDGRRDSGGQTNEDGVYRLYYSAKQGAMVGEHLVFLHLRQDSEDNGSESAEGEGGGIPWPDRVNVDSGGNEIDFELSELNR